jgi:hypothetical protein
LFDNYINQSNAVKSYISGKADELLYEGAFQVCASQGLKLNWKAEFLQTRLRTKGRPSGVIFTR